MIEIKEAISKKEIKAFVTFPFGLFQNNPNWIPPLIVDEMETFDKEKNPSFETADAKFYIAYRNGKAVGRVAAIINWTEVNELAKRKVRFGWFDVIDDIEVTQALLEKVKEFGRAHQMDNIEGPMGFSNLDKVGALTMGFDEVGTMVSWYTPKYYMDHFLQLGYRIEKTFIESKFDMPNEEQVKPYLRGEKMVLERYKLRLIEPKTTRDVLPYVDEMFDLFNSAYAKLSSFVPVTERQKQFFRDKYINLINPEYLIFIEDSNKKLVGFSIVMPSLSEALKKSNGRLFPFGWYHLMRAKKHSKGVLFYLIGVDPEYQNKGLTAVIMAQYFRVFNRHGITDCIRTPELEENNAIHNLWKNFNPIIHKKRSTFIQDL